MRQCGEAASRGGAAAWSAADGPAGRRGEAENVTFGRLGNRPPVALSAGWSFGAALAQADGVSGVQIKSAVRSAPGRSVCSACTPARYIIQASGAEGTRRANELRVRPSRCPRTALSADKAFAGQPCPRTERLPDRA